MQALPQVGAERRQILAEVEHRPQLSYGGLAGANLLGIRGAQQPVRQGLRAGGRMGHAQELE